MAEKLCAQCGEPNPTNANFCSTCGHHTFQSASELSTDLGPTASLESGPETGANLRLTISTRRIILLSVLSGGLYWFYLTWKQLEPETGEDHNPVWHALTLFVPFYNYFRIHRHVSAIKEAAVGAGVETSLDPGWAVTLAVVATALAGVSLAFDNVVAILVFSLMDIVLVTTIAVWAQGALNQYWIQAKGSGVGSAHIGIGGVVFVLLGLLTWVGLSLPGDDGPFGGIGQDPTPTRSVTSVQAPAATSTTAAMAPAATVEAVAEVAVEQPATVAPAEPAPTATTAPAPALPTPTPFSPPRPQSIISLDRGSDDYIFLDSEQGDSIGRGIQQALTTADGTFVVVRTRDNGVEINFGGPNAQWNLIFAAPGGAALAPGVYENATRWPFQEADIPGLSIFGNSSGCNRLTGSFEVLEASYGPGGEVAAFTAVFEQHCEERDPALFGKVRYKAPGVFVPTPTPLPPEPTITPPPIPTLPILPLTPAHIWSKAFGDAGNQHAVSAAVDSSSNVIVTGFFDGSVDFGVGMMTTAGDRDIFVAKFDTEGNHQWSKVFGDDSAQVASSVVVDSSGNVVVAGSFRGGVDFGGGMLTGTGDFDILVFKLDSKGNHLWSKRFGDPNRQVASSVAVDSLDSVFVTGNFEGGVDFGGGKLNNTGNRDLFVVKYDPKGNHVWSKNYGDAGRQSFSSVAVDSSGNVFVAANFEGSVDFGGDVLTSAGGFDIFVAKLNADGNHLWSNRFGDGDNPQFAHSVAVDSTGSIVIAGQFGGSVDFGGGTLTSAGDRDIFVAKFAP